MTPCPPAHPEKTPHLAFEKADRLVANALVSHASASAVCNGHPSINKLRGTLASLRALIHAGHRPV
jgi:hypothetical protein